MLERVVEQQPALCAVLLGSSDRVHRSYLPEGDECTLIEELLVILKPFVQATTFMSASSYPTIGMVYPLLYKLLHMTLSVTDDDSTIAKKAKLAILGDLNSRYAQADLVLFLKKYAYLDPRFKDLNPFVPLQERQDVIEAVKCDLIQLIEKRSQHEVEESGTSEPNPVDPPKSKKPKVASLLFSDFSNCKDSAEASSVMDLVQPELRRYNEEDLLEYDNDPMDWWRTHRSHYPILAKLIRKFWCVPATSVRSEELFSAAGNVLSQKRNRLLPENLDKLVFLCNNSYILDKL